MSPTERRASVPANANAYADEANEVELYPLRPIGRFRSSFSCRNGSPLRSRSSYRWPAVASACDDTSRPPPWAA